jgi:hypothetical protein
VFCLPGYLSEYTDLVTDCHSIWLGGETILLVSECTGVNDVRQSEMHTAEPPVPEPNVFDFDMVIENLNGHK